MPSTARTFERRLRQERERRGLSQADVARRVTELLGVTFYASALTKIESHERSVKIEEAVAFAEALDIPLSVLLVEQDDVVEAIGRAREDLLVAEHARIAAVARADEFTAEAQRLRGLIRELEASRGD